MRFRSRILRVFEAKKPDVVGLFGSCERSVATQERGFWSYDLGLAGDLSATAAGGPH